MPLHDYHCHKCGQVKECFVPLVELEKAIVTCCHREVKRVVGYQNCGDTSDYARKRFPYYDESLNVTFSSTAQKKKYLKDKGLEQTDGVHGIKKRRNTLYFT